jgi:hypothetical protein
MTIGKRLDTLEKATGAGACEACGALPGGKWPPNVRIRIDKNPERKPFVQRFCPRCGSPLNFTLNIATAGKGEQ